MSDVISLPDGTQHTISASDWAIARDIQNFKRDNVLPDTLPLYTKFSRSEEKNGQHYVTITLPSEQENNSQQTFKILVEQPLTHSFIIGPHSKKQPEKLVLGALQHEELPTEAEKKPYIYYRNEKDQQKNPVYNVRVKWFIPDPTAKEATACLYKSHLCKPTEVTQKLDIDIRRGISKKIKSNKIASFMEYTGGPSLAKYLVDNSLSRSEIIKIARQCCEEIQKLHTGKLEKNGRKCLHNDIKLPNFTYDKKNVRLVDEDAVKEMNQKGEATTSTFSPIIRTNNGKETRVSSYTAPEVIERIKKSGLSVVSVASDIYALGKTLQALEQRTTNFYVSDQGILSLIADLMAVPEGEIYPPLTIVLNWLECESLITSMSDYLQKNEQDNEAVENITINADRPSYSDNSNKSESGKRKTIVQKILREFYSDNNSNQLVSYFQLEALAVLFKDFPEIIEDNKEPWKTLLDKEKGPVLACAVLGAAEYLKFNAFNTAHHSDEGREAAKTLIKDLFNKAPTKSEQFSNFVSTTVNKATQGDGVTKRASGKRKHSRKTVFDKYAKVAKKMPSFQSVHAEHPEKPLTLEQQKVIVQLNQFFPKEHEKILQIMNDELVARVILKSMEYLEKSAGWREFKWHGKRAVKKLVITLLDKKIDNITKEVQDCCKASSSRYKVLGLFGRASSGNENSREKMLTEALAPVPHPE